MEQLVAAVCEDDRADRERLCGLIEASGVSARVSVFETGEEFLAAWQRSEEHTSELQSQR